MYDDFPIKNKKRDMRRHQRHVKVKKARDFAERIYLSNSEFYENYKDEYARKNADNMAPCSCWMCQNQRKVSGEKTVQERRNEQDKNDYI